MKKYFLFLFCLASSLMTSAQSGTCGNNVTWTLEDGVLTISGTGSISSYLQTSAPWYEYCSTISSIVIGEGVTSIGAYAFWDCGNLTSITIPNSVTYIGSGAFSRCTGLTSFVLNKSITELALNIFDGVHLRNIKCKSEQCPRIVDKNRLPAKEGNAFNPQILAHSILYVPEGVWENYAFDGQWYQFANIKEFAEEINQVSATNAYTLMSPDFQYAVYDEVNDYVRMVAHQQMNEENANSSWTLQTIDGNQYLYNIGAKKFATVDTEGAIQLTEAPVAIQTSNIPEGVSLNENATPWNFVKNDNLFSPEVLEHIVTGIHDVVRKTATTSGTFSLDGRRVINCAKGLYIQNGKKTLVH